MLCCAIKRYAKPWATPIGLSERIHHIRVAQGHQQLTLGHTDMPQSALGAQCPWPKVWQSVWNVINSYSDINSTKVRRYLVDFAAGLQPLYKQLFKDWCLSDILRSGSVLHTKVTKRCDLTQGLVTLL